uniref:Uncharacterized protein n=1 Tax=Glossina brevipalpis TaxID=37001 RepID=A0A1A9WDV5_9MUSC
MESFPSVNEEINEEIIKTISQKWELTQEDLKRQFTEAELKMLCMKHKTRVDMWKCNPVNEMKEKLEKDGRFKQRPVSYCIRLIAKGVNKYKRKIMYDPKVLQEWRKEDWRDRLKNSILSLELWFAEEKENQESIELERAVEESLELMLQEEYDVTSLLQNSEVENELQEFGHLDNGLPGSSKRTAQPTSQVDTQITSEINPEEVRTEIAEILDFNTESLSLNTQNVFESEVFSAPTNYDDFNRRISLTSTQSQKPNNPIIF